MTEEENARLVRNFVHEVLDGGNIDAADQYLTPNFINHVTGQSGVEPYKKTLRNVRALLNAPNVEEHIVADAEKVALFLTVSGVHDHHVVLRGRSYPPTGRRFSTRHVHLFRIRDGRLAEHWAIRDDLAMLVDLGMVEFLGPDQMQ